MFPLINTLTPLLGTVIDRLIPDHAEREKVKSELALKASELDTEVRLAQLELAKVDARSGKGGYRWATGWLCVVSLGYAWIIRDLLVWCLLISGSEIPPPPALPVDAQYAILMGLLGLSGVRSFDLAKKTRK